MMPCDKCGEPTVEPWRLCGDCYRRLMSGRKDEDRIRRALREIEPTKPATPRDWLATGGKQERGRSRRPVSECDWDSESMEDSERDDSATRYHGDGWSGQN
jgi:hypothetical protein